MALMNTNINAQALQRRDSACRHLASAHELGLDCVEKEGDRYVATRDVPLDVYGPGPKRYIAQGSVYSPRRPQPGETLTLGGEPR